MKKFKFRLERVLQYRITKKEEAKKELVLGLNQLYEAQNLLQSLIDAAHGRVIKEGEMTAAEVHMQGTFLAGIHQRVGETQGLIEVRKKEVEKLQKAYTEAAKEAESLQKLKDNRHREYLEHVEHEERKSLDELTVQRHGRTFYS